MPPGGLVLWNISLPGRLYKQSTKTRMKTEDMLILGLGAWMLLGKAGKEAKGVLPQIQVPQIQVPQIQVPQIQVPEVPQLPDFSLPGIVEGISAATGISALIPPQTPRQPPKTHFGPLGVSQAIAQGVALASQAVGKDRVYTKGVTTAGLVAKRSMPEQRAIKSVKSQISAMKYLQKKAVAARKMEAIVADLSPQASYARKQAIKSQKQHPLPIMKHRPKVERVSKRRVIKRRPRHTGPTKKRGGVTRRHKSWFS